MNLTVDQIRNINNLLRTIDILTLTQQEVQYLDAKIILTPWTAFKVFECAVAVVQKRMDESKFFNYDYNLFSELIKKEGFTGALVAPRVKLSARSGFLGAV